MKFCPKCGTMLVPLRKGKKLVLKCPSCGYEEKPKKTSNDYKIEVKTESSRKVKTTSIISEATITQLKKGEELEQEKEEFYEVFLELMSEEEGS